MTSFLTNKVFDIIESITPSDRGEYEITAVNNIFIERKSCDYAILKDRWADAGTMKAYHATNDLVNNEVQE